MSYGKTLIVYIAICLSICIGTPAVAATISVSNGDSIQAAIDAATDGDEIVLSRGTYREAIDFGTKRITVRGADPANNATVAATIIDGDVDSNPATYNGPVVTIAGGQGRETVLLGITLRGGTGKVENNLRWGGGIFIADSSPTLNRLRIIENRPHFGGGVYCRDGSPLIDACIIAGNVASNAGGGIQLVRSGGTELYSNLIVANTATKSSGGGIDVFRCGSAGPTIINNTIVENVADDNDGGGIFVAESDPVIRNNLVAWNVGCGVTVAAPATVDLEYNSFWQNGTGDCCGDVSCGSSNLLVDVAVIDRDGADNNVSTWSENNYHLSANSPCANAGDPAYQPSGMKDIDGDARIVQDYVDIGSDESLASYIYNYTRNSHYGTIQAAIDQAVVGDEIIVGPGRYFENIDFGGKNLTLRSSNPNDAAIVESTIIDGSRSSDYTHASVITLDGTEDPLCIIEGLTITGGAGTIVGDLPGTVMGGGVFGNGASPTIRHCRIVRNELTQDDELAHGGQGGGLWNCDGPITDCEIALNGARCWGDSTGGGLDSCDGPIQRCTVVGNVIWGIFSAGGGGFSNCQGEISECVIAENNTGDDTPVGGGFWRCHGRIDRCVIVGNFGGNGGGMFQCDGAVSNCVFAGNLGSYTGGAICSSSGEIRNCTMLGNAGDSYVGATTIDDCGSASIANCILWGNELPSIDSTSAVPSYSCVEAWTRGGVGNTDNDPLFMPGVTGTWSTAPEYDAETGTTTFTDNAASLTGSELSGATLRPGVGGSSWRSYFVIKSNTATTITVWGNATYNVHVGTSYAVINYHLSSPSPCINAGDPAFAAEPGQTDIDGDPRVLLGRVDMGADEATSIDNPCSTEILFVKADAEPNGDGCSWETAFNDLQDAIDTVRGSVSPTTQIWVAAGTYKPDRGTQDESTSFELVNGVALYGGFAGGETAVSERDVGVNETTLTGSLDYGKACLHVVTAADCSETAVIDGFTISGGHAFADYPDEDDAGGGILCKGGTPTIRNCVISNNSAYRSGAGICDCDGPIEDCVVIDNVLISPDSTGGGVSFCDGPIARTRIESNDGQIGSGVYGCNGSIRDCVITKNCGAIDGLPAGAVTNCHGEISRCSIIRNYGTAVYNSSASVSDSLIAGNVALEDWSAGFASCSGVIQNCVVVGNISADGSGDSAGTAFYGCSADIINCTIAKNWDSDTRYIDSGAPGAIIDSCTGQIINTIVWEDESFPYPLIANSTTPTWSCITNWSGGGEGNISSPPAFVRFPSPGADGRWNWPYEDSDDDYGDLHLLPDSPCINAGDPVFTAALEDTDIDGDPRVLFGRVDIGADEATSIDNPCSTEILFVKANAPADGDGCSWETAFNDLQDALAIAQGAGESVSQIWIAAGTYKPDRGTNDRMASFVLPTGIQVYGGFAGTESTLDERVLDDARQTIFSGEIGDLADHYDNACHVVTAVDTVAGTALDGIRVEGGDNVDSWECGGNDAAIGAGIVVTNSEIALQDCIVVNNRSWYGTGGVHAEGGNLLMKSCRIDDNRTGSWTAAGISSTGAIHIEDTSFERNARYGEDGYGAGYFEGNTELVRCQFTDNVGIVGGAFGVSDTSTVRAIDCVFIGNEGDDGSGGAISSSGDLSLVNSVFHGNFTEQYSGGGGGAVSASSGHLAVVNCLFTNNWVSCTGYSGGYGGAIRLATSGRIVNSTFFGNGSTCGSLYSSYGGALYSWSPDVQIDNCIFWGNVSDDESLERQQISWWDRMPVVRSSCVQGLDQLSHPSNIADDPLFVNPFGSDPSQWTGDEDWRLSNGSKCIDAGNNAAVPLDEYDIDNDGDTTETIPWDLDRNDRISNGTVDMGAYEYGSTPSTVAADFDHDGDVDGDDLYHFEQCSTGPSIPQADPDCQDAKLDADEDVDQSDFGLFQRCLSGRDAPADPVCVD